ncbi:hypothetical protein [Parerythrobacter lacustris]|uniref:PepSY domain-containing protein n=1 Tax=Parerythrobacter lacustris TaxID=2969984 RepID=A0ABT1XPI2_9SPHN|nr:hypothetical protein [Parerythrobacter lacustris]MCR2833570.1 hypothetical protein [Parerythrobacter lacustris]
MAVSPVLAADLPVSYGKSRVAQANVAQWDADGTNVERHRRWRHRDRIDGGDILAGVLILGGIAAIASAASDDNDRRDRTRDDYRYRENRENSYRSSNGGASIDRAVDMCLAEIERDVRVDEVGNVARTGDGWVVSGRLYNGDGFECRIDQNGRIADVYYSGDQASAGQAEDGQWSDEEYAEARRRAERTDYRADDAQPAYPGGPVEGEYESGDGYDGY